MDAERRADHEGAKTARAALGQSRSERCAQDHVAQQVGELPSIAFRPRQLSSVHGAGVGYESHRQDRHRHHHDGRLGSRVSPSPSEPSSSHRTVDGSKRARSVRADSKPGPSVSCCQSL